MLLATLKTDLLLLLSDGGAVSGSRRFLEPFAVMFVVVGLFVSFYAMVSGKFLTPSCGVELTTSVAIPRLTLFWLIYFFSLD